VKPKLLDHLVGPGKHRRRHVEAERLRSLEIDHELVFCWLLHRQIRRLFAFENTNDVGRRAPENVRELNPIEDNRRRSATASGDLLSRNPITGIAGCCARAASGHPATPPPTSVMNSRRFV